MKKIRLVVYVLFFFFLAEVSYFSIIFYQAQQGTLVKTGLIIIYSGNDNRTDIARDWNKKDKTTRFLFSGLGYSRRELEKSLNLHGRALVEDQARTTDQNARYSTPLIKQTGVKNVVLALPWYHLPRALFLTRYYLWGSGISVKPYATTVLPSRWWLSSSFWKEILNFWGSLGRIFLSWFGVENWPRPQFLFPS